MRVLGFSKQWPKLHLELPQGERPVFSTFRFPRKDAPKGRDWRVGESVQIVYHPRGKDREVLGEAVIFSKEAHCFRPTVGLRSPDDKEAIEDGFQDLTDMTLWFQETHGDRIYSEKINRLLLRWVRK